MSCNIVYSEDTNLKILTRTFKGIVTMTDIISSWEHVINDIPISNFQKGGISDYRGTDLRINIDDVYKLKNYFAANINIFKNLKTAQLVDTPTIALPMFFQMIFPDFQSKPFSTVEAAIYWINE